MSVAISYNGYSLPIQLGKVSFDRGYGRATFSAEFAIPASSVESAISTLKIWDQEFIINTDNWDFTANLSTNATALRSSVVKVGTTLDSRGRQRLRLTVIMDLWADRGGDGYFREWTATISTDEQGRSTVVIEGAVTKGGGSTAVENYNAGIAAKESGFLTIAGGTYETPAEVLAPIDRNNAELRFRRTSVELLETVNLADAAATETRNTNIIFTSWRIERSTVNEKGNDDPNVKLYRLTWGAKLKQGYGGVISVLEADIVALVIKRLKSQFSETGDLAIIGTDSIGYSSTGQEASASWILRVANSSTVSYAESVEMPQELLTWLKVMDGNDNTVELYSPGIVTEINQIVSHVMENQQPPIPQPPMIAGDFGPGARLWLKRVVPKYYEPTRVGRSIGLGDNATAPALDYKLEYTATFVLRVPPQNTPTRAQVTGPKGDLSRSMQLFG